ncbi:diguanylate cyclase (GGDEF) domain-containing protein [Marinobacter daqiaonensis]|uniref:diguanylate cyclase n=1 Tax=Marinobacter daqiaonensis TaxID=650891 RepID=A0A1I6ID08_9GAMM|nr:sensor domain-containing diguanylate cyclase [Marinobacter daqiaonensis]SFR64240.1 diguanylate cyclase (GGDEF) domain-containing protein [Marinobacter daqiaonensis]
MSFKHAPRHSQPHWVVTMNRRNRSLSFAAIFVTLASHIWLQQLSPWLLPILLVSFLVWPQLAYLRARESRDTMNAEFDNLIIDSVIFGLWISGLGFPLWIGFMLAISTSMNLMVFRGPRGLAQAFGGLTAGIVAGAAFTGMRFEPATHWLTTVMAVSSISMYLLLVGYVSYSRNLVLHEARERQRRIESQLKQQIEENRLLQERLHEQANRDPLTGLYNRRYLDDSLQREIDRCRRQQEPVGLLLIDIDHFKAINDEHGHASGDAVITQLATLLGSMSRASDIVCRFGGEEFLVVLPGTGREPAMERAEEYRQLFANTPVITEAGAITATLSVGVACWIEPMSPDELIREADKALYRAKNEGRNRVIFGTLDPAAAPEGA